jgi:hypothetical protein
MVVLAGFLIGWFFLETRAQEITTQIGAAETEEEKQTLRNEHQGFLEFFRYYWIGFLLVLLGIVGMAALDILATRRYGLRHFRQIQADRRAMIERQVARMRRDRNGHSEPPTPLAP